MASEEEIKARVERMAELFESRRRTGSYNTERGQTMHALEPHIRDIVRLEDALSTERRRRQEAESLAAQARHDAAAFEAAARETEKERTASEATLWREIEGLRESVRALRAAYESNMRVYLATVGRQS